MAGRIVVILIAVGAILGGILGADNEFAKGTLGLLLAILGLVYAAVAIDAEDSTAFLVLALAVGGAAGADALSNIPEIGGRLDLIVDKASIALYAGVATVLAVRAYNRIKG